MAGLSSFGRHEANEASPPVPDHVIAAIHRATPLEALALAKLLPEITRTRLALFCFTRAHLRDAGCAIAMACSDGDLVRYGGVAGQALVAQRALPKAATARRGSSRITLATPASQHLFTSPAGAEEWDEEEVA